MENADTLTQTAQGKIHFSLSPAHLAKA